MNATLIAIIILAVISGIILLIVGCIVQEEDKKRWIGIGTMCLGILFLTSAILTIPNVHQRWGAEKNAILTQLRAENKKMILGYVYLENVKMIRHKVKIIDGCDLTYWEIVE